VETRALLHHFGRRVRRARLDANLSQVELARRLGVGQDTISHYEQGHSMPAFVMVLRLSEVLGVHVTYFFPDESLGDVSSTQREALALLSSLPPIALEYVVDFIRHMSQAHQRRRFLTEEVLSHPDAQTRLVMILKRDLRRLETTLTQYVGESQRASLQVLVGFTALALVAMELQKGEVETEDIVHRVARNGLRLTESLKQVDGS
jgi:transcriptional regulator with XRE-family HTH domain